MPPHSDGPERLNPIHELVQREINRLKPRSAREAELIAADVVQRYNRTPQDELGGMSPEQVRALISVDWMGEAVVLNDKLTLRDLSTAPLFLNARMLLAAIHELGSVKATKTGAFNRKVAARMLHEFVLTEYIQLFMRGYYKAPNQRDVPFLELLRYLLPAAGLLLYRNGEFRVTKKGATLLAGSSAGDLYTLLFRTYWTKLDQNGFDLLPQLDIQGGLGLALYQMSTRLRTWVEIEEVSPNLLLPMILRVMPDFPYSAGPTMYASARLLTPLKNFGLLECDDIALIESPRRTRVSDLFDRFLTINVPAAL